ncbi:MAG: carbohydrate ABC transporter permease [Chloroflexi bacterium]|nr:carbohydrate ABC transporter permease [Chloroflexota bacterium]
MAMVQKVTPMMIVSRIFGYLILVAVAGMMVVPFMWMVTTSFKTPGTEFSYPPQILPTQFDVTNYQTLFNNLPFFRYFLNTLAITVVTVLGQLLVCSLAAYGFARLNFMGRDTIFVLYLTTMMIPFQITLIPLYLIITQLGWVNTYQGLIVPGISSAFGIFLLRQSFLNIPRDYQDAARIDGASEFTIYARIFLPLNGPTLATLGVFAFMGTWTDLIWPLLIARTEEMRTLELGLAYFNARPNAFLQPNWPLLMAGSVVVMLPVLVVYILAQRYFIQGIALSGVKG